MNSKFLSRLARRNLRKNARSYGPFILACVLTVCMFFIILALAVSPSLQSMTGATTVQVVIRYGVIVVGLFAVIFIFYTNSFLIKRRKREFGLFNVLGLEKKHLARVIGYETAYTALISLALGLALGVALAKLLLLVAAKILGIAPPMGFFAGPRLLAAVIGVTAALFGGIFLLIFLYSIRQVYVARPVELLQAEHAGEREPRAKWLMALLGLVCLGAGYYIAVTTTDVIQAMFLFFVAVVLVIVGTYLLFTAGSIALLKLLKRNKRYYYKTRHFTAVSGMMYRMKQNAVGLANICILSTMVLVMISGTSCLMLGMDRALFERYPYDMNISHSDEATVALTKKAVAEAGIVPVNEAEYSYVNFAAYSRPGGLDVTTDYTFNTESTLCDVLVTDLDDYNRCTGQDYDLGPDEILLKVDRMKYGSDTLELLGKTYTVKAQVEDMVRYGLMTANLTSTCYIVVPDREALTDLAAAIASEDVRSSEQYRVDGLYTLQRFYGFDVAGHDEETALDARLAVRAAWNQALEDEGSDLEGTYECRAWERQDFVSLYGSLFFLGVFLGLLFTMAAILIIYYKQMSEGRDDRERFQIMQKVGMSRLEVKRTIQAQVLIVFFLPLVTAGLHTGFAFPIINRVMALFNLMSSGFYLWCVLGSFGVFAALYAVVYVLTARTYYRLVSM